MMDVVKTTPGAVRLVRKAEALAITGDRNTQLYEKIKRGLMVRPVTIGGRAVGFPSDELQSIVAARIAGMSDEQIKELVDSLHERRKRSLAALLGDVGAAAASTATLPPPPRLTLAPTCSA